jgi:hypothetical protein
MRERLRALCKQITVAEEIDSEIQEELLTHMEDRLNGYLHGKDPITEEDAYLLVREHFGNPAVVKALMQHTHEQEANVSLGRRLAAIAAVSLGSTAAMKVINLFCTSLLIWASQRIAPESTIWSYIWSVQNLLLMCAITVLIWAFAYRWRQQIDRGLKPWFMCWPRRSVIRLLLGLGVVLYIVPSMAFTGAPYGASSVVSARLIAYMSIGLAASAMIAQAIAWLWWCDQPPRTKKALSYATLTWALFGACGSMPVSTITIATQEPAAFTTILKLASIDAQVWWSLALHRNLYGLLQMAGTSFIAFIAIGYAGRGIYWLARRFGKRVAGALITP